MAQQIFLTVTAGQITIQGGTINGTGAISSDTNIIGYGTVNLSSFDAADTVTASGGTLDFTNSVDSTTATTFNIANNSVLSSMELSAPTRPSTFLGIGGAIGVLDLESSVANSFHGVIANFTEDDEEIKVKNATSVSLDPGGTILTVYDASKNVLQTINFSTTYLGDTLSVASDGIITLDEIPLVFASAASISGTPQEGQVLTAVNGTFNDSDASVTGYQWTSDGVNIGGATSSTYVVQESDEGHVLRVVETATDGDGGQTTTSTSTPTAAVTDIRWPSTRRPRSVARHRKGRR